MDAKSRFFLQLQNVLGRAAIFLIAPLCFFIVRILFYRIRNLREIRRQCAEEFAGHKGPWIICANHLTMIDSFILIYASFSFVRHITHYKRLPWNLPEKTNFQSTIFLAVFCYLSRCIPVHRGGSREKMKQVLDACIYLLRNGQSIMIFPEGGRSRTGRVDKENFSYGVGRFIQNVENCKVMCFYLRGDRQRSYSLTPAWGDKFYVQMDVFKPAPAVSEGLRAQREYAAQIINRLAQMEDNYFAAYEGRYRGFKGFREHEKKYEFAISEENSHR